VDLSDVRFLQKSRVLRFKLDVEGSMLTPEFEVETSSTVLFCILS